MVEERRGRRWERNIEESKGETRSEESKEVEIGEERREEKRREEEIRKFGETRDDSTHIG